MIEKEFLLMLFGNGRFNVTRFKKLVTKEQTNYLFANYRTIQECVYCVINDTTPKKCNIGDITIKLQGYEPQFLDFYLKENSISSINYTRDSIPSINYSFKNKDKVYHPDFYIPSSNTIIEVKSTWTYKSDIDKNKAKQKACLEQGYNFNFYIMDKNGDVLEII